MSFIFHFLALFVPFAFVPRTAAGTPALPSLPRPSHQFGLSCMLSVHRDGGERLDTTRGTLIANRKTNTLFNRLCFPQLVRTHFSITRSQHKARRKRHNRSTRASLVHNRVNPEEFSHHTLDSTGSVQGKPQKSWTRQKPFQPHILLHQMRWQRTFTSCFLGRSQTDQQTKCLTYPLLSAFLLRLLSSVPFSLFFFCFPY